MAKQNCGLHDQIWFLRPNTGRIRVQNFVKYGEVKTLNDFIVYILNWKCIYSLSVRL